LRWLDARVGGRLADITEEARFDAMRCDAMRCDAMRVALAVLGAFVVLVFIAARFLPPGKLADSQHPVEEGKGRFERRAPTPARPI